MYTFPINLSIHGSGHRGSAKVVLIQQAHPNPPYLPLPLSSSQVSAGFPSPADDYLEGTLDLNEYLVSQPAATFHVRVTGESMVGAGILPGDVLVVDRSVTPAHGQVVIAVVDGELTVKRLYRYRGKIELRPENEAFRPIELSGEQELVIWGVVTGVARKL